VFVTAVLLLPYLYLYVLVVMCGSEVGQQQTGTVGSSVLMNLLMNGLDVDFGYRLRPGLQDVS